MAKEKSGDNFSFCSFWAKKTHFPPQPGSETSSFDLIVINILSEAGCGANFKGKKKKIVMHYDATQSQARRNGWYTGERLHSFLEFHAIFKKMEDKGL